MTTKSGVFWVNWANENAKNSNQLIELEREFRENVEAFISALREGKASVRITSTRRNAKRAYLFHWAWRIATGSANASDATAMDGVDIEWDHGSASSSKNGALEMVNGFGLAMPPNSNVAPSLTSNHIMGKAIDMTILWTGEMTVNDKAGNSTKVQFSTNVNTNTQLHKVGASYGVYKLTSDAPHWSHNGR
ncbi:hypothetical protein [Lampropedia aestuarii]|nr:hypothetical protein [Lampropedia aestuarii]MDH5858240.1 hypothetical protein [Lampropedia aestuarii]